MERFGATAIRHNGTVSVFFNLALALSAVVVLTVAGCGKAGPERVDDGAALVTFNGGEVTVKEFKSAHGEKVPSDFEARKKDAVSLAMNKLIARLAREQNIVSGTETSSALENLYSEKMPLLLYRELLSNVKVSDEEVEMFGKPKLADSLKVDMIVAKTPDFASDALAELEGGAAFEDVYRKNPDRFMQVMTSDKTINMDDDLYPVGIRAALNGLQPGGLSQAMKLPIGYAIFRLNKRITAEDQWKAMKKDVAARMRAERAKQEMDNLADELRSKADIKIERLPTGFKATVDGVVISHEGYLSMGEESEPHSPHSGFNEKTVMDALNHALRNYLLSKEARRRGLDKKNPAFQTEIEIESDKALTDEYIAKMTANIPVTSQDLVDYYNKNKELLASKELVEVSRILLTDEATAKKVMDMLKSGGNFAELAKKHSKDEESAAKGGNVGWVPLEGLKESIAGVLGGLDVGSHSGIVKTEYGYEVLMVTGRKQPVVPPYEEVKESIRKKVALTKRSDFVRALFDRLYKENDVRVNEDLLRSL